MPADMLQEMNDDPTAPLEARIKLFEGLDHGNRHFGIYRKFMTHFDRWFIQGGFVHLPRPLRFLELGAGSGGLIRELAAWGSRQNVDIEFHVMDADPAVLQSTELRLKQIGIDVVSHLSGETHLVQFQTGEFDFIYSLHVLHHIQPQAVLRDALKQSMRVARHGVFMMDFGRRFYNSPLKYMMYFGTPFFGIDWRLSKELARDGIISITRSYANRDIEKLCSQCLPTGWRYEVKSLFQYFSYFILTVQSNPSRAEQ